MAVGRVFDGIDDWLEVQFSLPPFGGEVVENFTFGGWIQTSDSAGVDRGVMTAHDATAQTSWGFYWNKDELLVKYAHRPTGSPGGSGTNEEKSVSYTTELGTPTFVAVTATMDSPGSSAAIPTFRFYAGTTAAGIVQIGGTFAATSSIKSSSRNFAIGAATTGSGTQTATAGTFFAGIIERFGLFHFEAFTLAELQDYAYRGIPHTINAYADFGEVGGQSFEMWDLLPSGDDFEKDVGINFFTAEFRGGMVEADVTDSILPDTFPNYSILNDADLGTGTRITDLQVLDSGRVLAAVQKSSVGSSPAEMWASDDDGVSWTLLHTFPSSPNATTIDQMVDLGSGVVIGTGQVLSADPKIWKSTDFGDTWTEVDQPAVAQIRSLFNMGGGRVLAGTGTGGKIFESTDSGDNWAELVTISGINSVRSIVDLGGGEILAGGNANDIYRSTDDGASFSSYATMSGGTTGQVQMRQLDSGRIIATTHRGNVYVSDDDGANWTHTFENGDFISLWDNSPSSVIIGPIDSKYFIRAAAHGYLFETEDEGDTFTKYYYNLQGPTTQDAAVLLPNNKILLGGNYWLCSPALLIYQFSSTPQIRVVNERRIIALGKVPVCAVLPGACCHPVVMTTPRQGRTAPYTKPRESVPAQHRTIPYTEDPAPPPGAVNVTRIQKLIEYRETPRDTLGGEDTGVLATCSFRVKVKIVRVEDLVQVFELDQYARLEYTKRWTEMDDFTLRMSADTVQAREMLALGIVPTNGKFIVNVFIEGLPDFAGFIDNITIEITNRGEHIWTMKGLGVDRILSDRLVLPPAGQAYDRYEGPAESIMKSLVNRHMVAPIATGISNIDDAGRAISQLVIAADAGLGSSVKFEGRFQKLQEGLLQISRSSNDIGFGVKLIDSVLIFEVSQGVDRSRQCVLAVELDNLGDFQLEQNGTQFVSHVIMGGTGEAAERTLLAVSTDTSTRIGIERREAFQDARDLDTTTALNDKGVAFLQERGLLITMGGNKLVGTHPCYRRDFQVGDFITMRNAIYNLSQVTRLMEARITVEGGKLEQVDLGFEKPKRDPIKFMRTAPPITASSRI